MDLLQLEDIQRQLYKKYSLQVEKFPRYFRGMIPVQAPVSQTAEVTAVVAQIAGHEPPEQFRNILGEWDLGNLSLAGFRFAVGTSYAEALVRMNSFNGNEWWADREDDTRPANLIMIAQSDPYILLLDLDRDQVLAFSSMTGSAKADVVAADLRVLLRALGTAELLSRTANDREAFAKSLATASGSENFVKFWQEQVDHWATY